MAGQHFGPEPFFSARNLRMALRVLEAQQPLGPLRCSACAREGRSKTIFKGYLGPVLDGKHGKLESGVRIHAWPCTVGPCFDLISIYTQAAERRCPGRPCSEGVPSFCCLFAHKPLACFGRTTQRLRMLLSTCHRLTRSACNMLGEPGGAFARKSCFLQTRH